jgi:hypothetical protein
MAFSVAAFSEAPFGAEPVTGLVLFADGSTEGTTTVTGSILEVANPTATAVGAGTVGAVTVIDVTNIVTTPAVTGTGATAGAILEVANVTSDVTGTAVVSPTLAFAIANVTTNVTGTSVSTSTARAIANQEGIAIGTSSVPNVNTTAVFRNLSIARYIKCAKYFSICYCKLHSFEYN